MCILPPVCAVLSSDETSLVWEMACRLVGANPFLEPMVLQRNVRIQKIFDLIVYGLCMYVRIYMRVYVGYMMGHHWFRQWFVASFAPTYLLKQW